MNEARIEDVWADFVAAAEDAVRASYRESHDTLRRLIAALDAQPLAAVVSESLPEADFATWLEASISSIGSMAGSGSMSWPTKTEERVAMQVALLRELAAGRKITVQGLLMNFYTSRMEEGYSRFVQAVLQPCLRDFARVLQSKVEARRTSTETAVHTANPKTVFVVHGRNSAARDAMFQFLRAIGLHPLEWIEAVALTKSASPYVGAILEKAFSVAQAVVVLMTGDDEAQLRLTLHGPTEEHHEVNLTPQARPNVLFEAGLAFGSHPDRTILVELGRLRPFSDIGGRHTVRLTNQTERRQDLAVRLRNAGCSVNLDGTDWHKAGDFDAALK